MSSIGSTSTSKNVTINNVNVIATVWNVPIALANTEVSFNLPADTHKFLLRPRTACEMKLSYALGQSGTTYVTIPPRTNFTDENYYSSQTIYFQSNIAGITVEIVTYNT